MKIVLSIFAAVFATAAFAAANDVLITFSTPGPDKYADGKTVLDGERYALCWSQDFSKFAIKADGTVEGGKLVVAAPVAKGGRCPTIIFEVDADYAAANFVGGSWAVYMLDTRKFADDGSATLAGTLSVNTAGLVGTVTVGSGSTLASLTGAAGAATDLAAGADVPKPQVTGIRIVDGYVYVTVKGTVPYLAYGLVAGSSPDAVAEAAGEAQAGAVAADDEITLVTPAKEGGQFFKVGRK